MAWVSGNWSQDDLLNGGFPYITGLSPSGVVDLSETSTIWMVSSEFNGGFPALKSTQVQQVDVTQTSTIWGFNANINDGFPYIKAVYPRKGNFPSAYVRRPLMVYDQYETDFNHNGIRVLRPISATRSLDFGQAGELTIVHPIDSAGAWRTLVPNNIILSPCTFRGQDRPQPFRIYRIVTEMQENGQKTVTAYARHVFYDLSYCVLQDVRPENLTGAAAIAWMFEKQLNRDFVRLASEPFTFDSDIQTTATAYYQNVSIANALIGADNAFIYRWGGELYVDKFYFSINQTMENSRQNDFNIRYSYDMMAVSEDIDYTDLHNDVIGFDNFASMFRLLENVEPFAKPIIANFSYDEFDFEQLKADVIAYHSQVHLPNVVYTVKYAPIWKKSDYGEFSELRSREVGDTGIITNPMLNITTTQRITHKVTDELNGECLEIGLGNSLGTLTAPKRWSNTVTTGAPSAIEKQIQADELARLGTWNDISGLLWQQVEQYTWDQIGGN